MMTSTLIEAMKQALEALKNGVDGQASIEMDEAIISLIQAIAELESQEQNFCTRCGKRSKDIHTCTPPQRTEQEPQIAFNAEVVGYIAPQRTWVGLTRMDLIKCGVLPFGMSYELCQAIEAKLKEKNT
jgi:hypothetical protein